MVTIERKKAFDWEGLRAKVEKDHWRKFKIVIQIREKMHAGKPAQLDAANAMLKARGLEEVVEAREAERPLEERIEETVDQGPYRALLAHRDKPSPIRASTLRLPLQSDMLHQSTTSCTTATGHPTSLHELYS